MTDSTEITPELLENIADCCMAEPNNAEQWLRGIAEDLRESRPTVEPTAVTDQQNSNEIITKDPCYHPCLYLLAEENTGWRRWFRRWKYSSEPFRSDIANRLGSAAQGGQEG